MEKLLTFGIKRKPSRAIILRRRGSANMAASYSVPVAKYAGMKAIHTAATVYMLKLMYRASLKFSGILRVLIP